MSNRIAILVLACASPPYDELIEAIRRTWGSPTVPGLDIYYLYGNPGDQQAYACCRVTLADGPVLRTTASARSMAC